MRTIEEEAASPLDELPLLLTVEEAAAVLRIGRTLAYALARRYEASGGREGLPVVRLGGCLRVPRWALIELACNGRVVALSELGGGGSRAGTTLRVVRPAIERIGRRPRQSVIRRPAPQVPLPVGGVPRVRRARRPVSVEQLDLLSAAD
ncbi:MAG: helix-turn-helix domain-containing protein [Acidimicrobiia bacterium]|nr:helix-turn-helix domain-containing protein [Acidimicrobiia bacterium]